MSAPTSPLDRRAWRQIGLITAVAVALFALFRWLPTGTNLSHMDFRATGANSIEFCDPLNPQFIPVVAVRSPVTLTLARADGSAASPVPGQATRFILTLRTASGKPIAPEDLLVSHTRLLHLLIIDPWLNDYQHVHPEPAARAGDWTFAFTPKREGNYRVFADFTPAATGQLARVRVYVANNNSVVRFPYQSGDLKARGAAEVIVPRLTQGTGGHTTRGRGWWSGTAIGWPSCPGCNRCGRGSPRT